MPAVRKLPPAHVLRQLRMNGWKLKDIAKEYDVTEPAVWRALDRAGMVEQRASFKDIFPWDVLPTHKTTGIMERFRTILKQKNGQETSATEERLLAEWLKGMSQNGVVVNYHPEAPANSASSKGGFYYSPRDKSDEWIVRQPPIMK